MMKAQDENVSHYVGRDYPSNSNRTVSQSGWGFFTYAVNGMGVYSIIIVTDTKITLLRSETLDHEPTPFKPCDQGAFQNEAFGGNVSQTDCVGLMFNSTKNTFFGQVDTSAVLILYGLGNGRSNLSSESFDDKVDSWIYDMRGEIDSLLMARGYIASVDPSLVAIGVKTLTVAVSGLQLFLSAFAALLAAAAWLGLLFFADAHWSNTFLSNLVYSTATSGLTKEVSKPGYMYKPPEIGLLARGSGEQQRLLTLDRQPIVLGNPLPDGTGSVEGTFQQGLGSKGGFEITAGEPEEHEESTGRDGLLSHYRGSS
jgi:hypothetical protein